MSTAAEREVLKRLENTLRDLDPRIRSLETNDAVQHQEIKHVVEELGKLNQSFSWFFRWFVTITAGGLFGAALKWVVERGLEGAIT